MKNQAILITAYKDYEQLVRLIQQLINDYFIYIHVDKKSSDIYKNLIVLFGNKKDCFIFSDYSISWGEYSHLMAIRSLLKETLKNQCLKYVHIISGQDYIVGSRQDFSKLLQDRKIYMTCCKFENTPKDIQNRYNKFHFIPKGCDIRSRSFNRFDKLVCKFQNHRHTIGLFNMNHVYKGVAWVSMPIEAVKYVVSFSYTIRGRLFHLGLRSCLIPEEVYFQTILSNSRFKDTIVPNNRRYTVWTYKNGSIPAILDLSDYDAIQRDDYLFCRKVDSKISFELIETIDSRKKLF